MIDQNADLGATLRAHRERRGITLDALAASMKVRRSLLMDLEGNDISRWPHGIYRRAFIRQYATLVGLPPETVIEQFCGLFPEPPEALRLRTAAAESSAELRLTLDDMPSHRRSLAPSHVTAVAGLLGLVLVTSGVLALLTGLGFWTVLGVVALISYPFAGAISVGGVSFRRLRRIRLWPNASSRAADDQPLVLHVARSERQDADDAFEGDGAGRGEGHGLPLPTSGQVH